MKTPHAPMKPLEIPSDDSTGSDTERNYRYQHAYGVILLIGAATKKLPYVAVYVEHHEDLLCERLDNRVDGYQIKTRNPEEGDWDLSDEAIKKSIKRFVELNKAFPEHIFSLKLVSNVNFSNPGSDIKDQAKLKRSPIRFLEMVQKCSSFEDITFPFDKTFRGLREYCGCSPEELFLTLQKVELLKGPERTSFDSEIVTTHLTTLPVCSSYSVLVLNKIREELILKVYLASHVVDDPSKHWNPINKISPDNPHITSKRLPVEVVLQIIQDNADPPFRYYVAPTLATGNGQGNLWKLRKKMEKGDLQSQILTMENRSISAEQKLIEKAIEKPSEIDAFLSQLEGIVQGECDEAYLHAKLTGKPIGPQMLDEVYRRLRQKAELQSDLVLRQPYELLIGVAGLLTGECKVWWSEPFEIPFEKEGAE
jgi:hypothetical protein